jgi:hypothetical protein
MLELIQTAFWRGNNGEYIQSLKYSLPIFVELIYKIQRIEVSGAVRPPIWVVRRQRVNAGVPEAYIEQ